MVSAVLHQAATVRTMFRMGVGSRIDPNFEGFVAMPTKNPKRNHYILREIARYPVFKADKHRLIVAHVTGEMDLRKAGHLLTAEEKVKLRLNHRRPVSSAMIDLIDPGFVALFDVDEALSLIASNARNKYSLHRKWNEFVQDPAVNRLALEVPHDAMTCQWCRRLGGQPLKKRFNLPVGVDESCRCVWFRGDVVAMRSGPGMA